MNKTEDIRFTIEKLNKQLQGFVETGEDIPAIEIDILLEQLRSLYVLLQEYKQEQLISPRASVPEPERSSAAIIPEKETSPEPMVVPPPEPEAIIDEKPEEPPVLNFEEPGSSEAEIPASEVAPPVSEEVLPPTPPVFETTEPSPPPIFPEPRIETPVPPGSMQSPLLDLFATETIADKYKGNGTSVADKIKEQQKDNSLADTIRKGRISDIKSVIGINEKFLFINKLFDGSLKDYNNALDNINKFENIEQVNNYLKILSETFRWDPKNPALETFRGLIGRKF